MYNIKSIREVITTDFNDNTHLKRIQLCYTMYGIIILIFIDRENSC